MGLRPRLAVLVGLPLFLLAAGCTKLSDSPDGEPTMSPAETDTPEGTQSSIVPETATPPSAATSAPQDEPAAPTQQPETVVVSGFFARTFGDPPSGENGRARISYTLTTSGGEGREEWILVFDKDTYWPADGVRRFHLKQVVVKGTLMPDGTLLVKLLESP